MKLLSGSSLQRQATLPIYCGTHLHLQGYPCWVSFTSGMKSESHGFGEAHSLKQFQFSTFYYSSRTLYPGMLPRINCEHLKEHTFFIHLTVNLDYCSFLQQIEIMRFTVKLKSLKYLTVDRKKQFTVKYLSLQYFTVDPLLPFLMDLKFSSNS